MSEFGKGFVYCLVLFAKHVDGARSFVADAERSGVRYNPWALWLCGASDHLYELEAPESAPADLRKRVSSFKDRMLAYRAAGVFHLSEAFTKEAFQDMVEDLGAIAMAVDEWLGASPEKAEYE